MIREAMKSMRFIFGASQPIVATEDGVRIELPVPLLSGKRDARIANLEPDAHTVHLDHGATICDSRLLAGALCIPDPYPLAEQTRQAYETVIRSCQDYALVRIWNYVPHINQHTGDLEAYRAFCKGRSEAFADHQLAMPAASAVGIHHPFLIIAFIATRDPVVHVENPEQVPAYCYPDTYGPRPPSFSRASLIHGGDGRTRAFVSGTAAIKGHASMYPGSLADQVEVTLDNLSIMQREVAKHRSGMPESCKPLLGDTTIYIRKPDHAAEIIRMLDSKDLLSPTSRVVHADICRAELLVEIETQDPDIAAPSA